jgi:hypothetical protein
LDTVEFSVETLQKIVDRARLLLFQVFDDRKRVDAAVVTIIGRMGGRLFLCVGHDE